MNIELQNIVDNALSNLKNVNSIDALWSEAKDNNIHGTITFNINSKNISWLTPLFLGITQKV